MKNALIRYAIFALIVVLSPVFSGGGSLFISPAFAQEVSVPPGLLLNKDHPAIQAALETKNRNSARLMKIQGVIGTAIGLGEDGNPVIKVYTLKAGTPDIPEALEGLPVRVVVTGMIVALTDPTARQDRPVPIGVSTGHPDITAGTIGARVTDGSNVYALSNNHVYANLNKATINDEVIQPGTYDGGKVPNDVIGKLSAYEPINFHGGNNIMDAAIAFSSTADLNNATPADDGYGTPTSVVTEAALKLPVQKYGRTTGLTNGQIDGIGATVKVCYEVKGLFCKKIATFINQIEIIPGTFSAGGDSGSLIVDMNRNPIGLLFAGSSQSTFANPIGAVLARFGVSIDQGAPVTDIAVTSVDAPASVLQNESVTVAVTVSNTGDVDVTDDINVRLTDITGTGSVVIATQTITGGLSVDDKPTTTLTFDWNSGSSVVTHILSATLVAFSDDNSTNNTKSTSVTVNEPPGTTTISLTASGYLVRGLPKVDLEWNGASSKMVDILRNSSVIKTTKNDGFYTDDLRSSGNGLYIYQVCEAGSSTCSNEDTVIFP